MVREQEHIDKMLDTYRQYITSKSWKRRNDLKKRMQRLEKEWFAYMKLKNENQRGSH